MRAICRMVKNGATQSTRSRAHPLFPSRSMKQSGVCVASNVIRFFSRANLNPTPPNGDGSGSESRFVSELQVHTHSRITENRLRKTLVRCRTSPRRGRNCRVLISTDQKISGTNQPLPMTKFISGFALKHVRVRRKSLAIQTFFPHGRPESTQVFLQDAQDIAIGFELSQLLSCCDQISLDFAQNHARMPIRRPFGKVFNR